MLPLFQMEQLYLDLEISVQKRLWPVMEGKALLFKSFADVDAFPLCLDTIDPDKVVEVVKLLEPTFGGVNLEDIKAPECFEIEDRLRKACQFPFSMMINTGQRL